MWDLFLLVPDYCLSTITFISYSSIVTAGALIFYRWLENKNNVSLFLFTDLVRINPAT